MRDRLLYVIIGGLLGALLLSVSGAGRHEPVDEAGVAEQRQDIPKEQLDDAAAVGRYQIVFGECVVWSRQLNKDAPDTSSGVTQPVCMTLDTVTGESWLWSCEIVTTPTGIGWNQKSWLPTGTRHASSP